jgi:hypothetical protein
MGCKDFIYDLLLNTCTCGSRVILQGECLVLNYIFFLVYREPPLRHLHYLEMGHNVSLCMNLNL